MTGASLYRSLENDSPTLLIDEAESLQSEASSTLRAILNVGYRKGQYVRRTLGNEVKEYPTYCPKVFVLIGDVYDTLRDRSIVIRMRRASTSESKTISRFVFEIAKAEGAEIRANVDEVVKENVLAIGQAYLDFSGLDFLTDRDEEIWTPLFVLCKILAPHRFDELQRMATDIATEKTAPKKNLLSLAGREEEMQDAEYAEKLLTDVMVILGKQPKQGHRGGKRSMQTLKLLDALKDMPTAPWRKIYGTGVDEKTLSRLLGIFGVAPKVVRFGKTVARAYIFEDCERAFKANFPNT